MNGNKRIITLYGVIVFISHYKAHPGMGLISFS